MKSGQRPAGLERTAPKAVLTAMAALCFAGIAGMADATQPVKGRWVKLGSLKPDKGGFDGYKVRVVDLRQQSQRLTSQEITKRSGKPGIVVQLPRTEGTLAAYQFSPDGNPPPSHQRFGVEGAVTASNGTGQIQAKLKVPKHPSSRVRLGFGVPRLGSEEPRIVATMDIVEPSRRRRGPKPSNSPSE